MIDLTHFEGHTKTPLTNYVKAGQSGKMYAGYEKDIYLLRHAPELLAEVKRLREALRFIIELDRDKLSVQIAMEALK